MIVAISGVIALTGATGRSAFDAQGLTGVGTIVRHRRVSDALSDDCQLRSGCPTRAWNNIIEQRVKLANGLAGLCYFLSASKCAVANLFGRLSANCDGLLIAQPKRIER